VVIFTPQPLYPQYPLARRLGGPQSQSGQLGEEKILAPIEVNGKRVYSPKERGD
jgi:hypothetical protein